MKKVIAMLLVVCMTLSMVACGAKSETATEATGETAANTVAEESKSAEKTAASDEKVTLTLWVNGTMETADELKLPEEERWLRKTAARFQETHPNVEFEIVNYGDDTAQMVNDFKAALISGEGPDIITPFAGTSILDMSSGLVALNDYLDDDLKDNIVGWNTCSEDFDETKNIYGIPHNGQSVVFPGYNKAIIKACGLDYENDPPQTREEWYEDMNTIRDAGYEVFHTDESFTLMLCYLLGMWWEQETGLDGILAHSTEKTLFAEDQGFLNMLTEYQKFYENGWINADTATSADSTNVFMQGGCAFYPAGAWDTANFTEALGDDYGIIQTPSGVDGLPAGAIGGCGEAVCVSNISKNVDLAVEFAKFICTRESFLELYQMNPLIPIRTDITAADMGMEGNEIFEKEVAMASNIYYWPDNCLSIDAGNVYYGNLPSQVLTGAMTPMELAQAMDEAQTD